jgi:hypothetical protein
MAVAFIRSVRISAVVLLIMATALTLIPGSGKAYAQSYDPDGNVTYSNEGAITNPGGALVQAYFERVLAAAYRDSPSVAPGVSWVLCTNPGQAGRWVPWNGYTRRSSC